MDQQQHNARVKNVNLIIGSMAVSTVFIFGMAVYFYFADVVLVSYIMLAYALLMIPFLFWFRRQLMSKIEPPDTDA